MKYKWFASCIVIATLCAFVNGFGNNLEMLCRCLPKSICPRVLGSSEVDLKYFKEIPTCEDENEVRCCGVSTSFKIETQQNIKEKTTEETAFNETACDTIEILDAIPPQLSNSEVSETITNFASGELENVNTTGTQKKPDFLNDLTTEASSEFTGDEATTEFIKYRSRKCETGSLCNESDSLNSNASKILLKNYRIEKQIEFREFSENSTELTNIATTWEPTTETVTETGNFEPTTFQSRFPTMDRIQNPSFFDEAIVTTERSALENDPETTTESVNYMLITTEDTLVGSTVEGLEITTTVEPIIQETTTEYILDERTENDAKNLSPKDRLKLLEDELRERRKNRLAEFLKRRNSTNEQKFNAIRPLDQTINESPKNVTSQSSLEASLQQKEIRTLNPIFATRKRVNFLEEIKSKISAIEIKKNEPSEEFVTPPSDDSTVLNSEERDNFENEDSEIFFDLNNEDDDMAFTKPLRGRIKYKPPVWEHVRVRLDEKPSYRRILGKNFPMKQQIVLSDDVYSLQERE